jgi:hypothetical protein
MKMFEVQTRFLHGWENCWTEGDAGIDNPEGTPLLFDTEQEAEDAILELFADLGASGMANSYDKEDYRVVSL